MAEHHGSPQQRSMRGAGGEAARRLASRSPEQANEQKGGVGFSNIFK